MALMALTVVALVVVAFGAGVRLGRPADLASSPEPPPAADVAVVPAPPVGRVLFAERLGESLELEDSRTQFDEHDTIAWRAEFLQPPPTTEMTLVIAWQSIRETMQLSRTVVPVADDRLTVVASDEVPLGELVPTAGLYSVAYYADDTKLAEGTFELLPPDR